MKKGLIAIPMAFFVASLAISSPTPAGIEKKNQPKRPAERSYEIREGWYAFTGKADEVTYHGAATVRKINQQYVVRWMLDGGAANGYVVGTGFRTGEILSLGWSRGETCGVSVYRIEADGVLTGHWVQWRTGDGLKIPETLTWEKAFAKDKDAD